MKTIVITGASKGFGFFLSKEFAENDYNVIMNSRSLSNLEKAKLKIQKNYPRAKIYCVAKDISKQESATYIAKKTKDKYGSVDYWINNAGTLLYKYDNFKNFDNNEICQIVNTNLTGTLLGMKAAINIMEKQTNGGHIYNILGCGSKGEIIPGYSIYSTSKYPIDYMTKCVNQDLKEKQLKNIKVNTISPGIIDTDLYKYNDNLKNSIVNVFCSSPNIVAKYTFLQIHRYNLPKIEFLTPLRMIGILYNNIFGL